MSKRSEAKYFVCKLPKEKKYCKRKVQWSIAKRKECYVKKNEAKGMGIKGTSWFGEEKRQGKEVKQIALGTLYRAKEGKEDLEKYEAKQGEINVGTGK